MAKEKYYLVPGKAIGYECNILISARPVLQGKSFVRQRKDVQRQGGFILTPRQHFMLRKFLAENDPAAFDYLMQGKERLNQVIIGGKKTLTAFDSPPLQNGKFSLVNGRDVSYLIQLGSGGFVLDDINPHTGLPLSVFARECYEGNGTHELRFFHSRKKRERTMVPAVDARQNVCVLHISDALGVKKCLPEYGVRICYRAADGVLENADTKIEIVKSLDDLAT